MENSLTNNNQELNGQNIPQDKAQVSSASPEENEFPQFFSVANLKKQFSTPINMNGIGSEPNRTFKRYKSDKIKKFLSNKDDDNNNKSYCTSDLSCPKNFSKLIPEKRICIDECYKDPLYRFEFRHTCYEECPLNISEKSEIKNFYCKAKCSKEYPFEIIETQFCVNNCSINERQNNLCKINYISNDDKEKEAEDKAVENIKEELTKDFNTSDIDQGDNIVIKQKDSTITISSTENQKSEKNANVTSIDLGDCENKLKEEYNISKEESLLILKIDALIGVVKKVE